MKKIFENFWLLFAAMMLVAIVDLIGLGTIDAAGKQWDFGAGFVLTGAFFFWWIIRKMRGK